MSTCIIVASHRANAILPAQLGVFLRHRLRVELQGAEATCGEAGATPLESRRSSKRSSRMSTCIIVASHRANAILPAQLGVFLRHRLRVELQGVEATCGEAGATPLESRL